jgi:hypothetical protein
LSVNVQNGVDVREAIHEGNVFSGQFATLSRCKHRKVSVLFYRRGTIGTLGIQRVVT